MKNCSKAEMDNFPALILSYSRPKGTEQLIQSLAKQGVSRIYISLDGSKNLKDAGLSSETLARISTLKKEYPNIQFKVQIGQENLGSGVGVFSGIDWFFNHERAGIILEDDLIVGSNLCAYFNLMLTQYESVDEVGMITGTKLFSDHIGYAWTTYPVVWGWATWRDRWTSIKAATLAGEFHPSSELSSIAERNYWKIGRRRALSRTIDAWDIPFAAEFHNRNLKCVSLPKNQVSNVGNDLFATHTRKSGWPLGIPIENTNQIDLPQPDLLSEKVNSLDGEMKRAIFGINFLHVFSYPLGIIRLKLTRNEENLNAFREKFENARFKYE